MISRRAFTMIVPMAAASTLRLRAAGVDGKWEAEIESPRGPMVLKLDLKSEGESLTGTIGNDLMGDVEIQEGKVSGDDISFVQVQARGDFEIRMMYTGKVTGDEMELTRSVERPPGGRGGGRPGGGRPPQGGPGALAEGVASGVPSRLWQNASNRARGAGGASAPIQSSFAGWFSACGPEPSSFERRYTETWISSLQPRT